MKKVLMTLLVIVILAATTSLYAYNYNVTGEDTWNGTEVTEGDIYAPGGRNSSVEGTITLDNGEEVDVEGHWTGYGTMEVEDYDGN
ncbi:MAG: hypothetical protein JRE23_17090, partial [Deltaproteobacteria bacterium]|nr:hypothetical protein [Deltaproteobacteria bacterium]